MLPVHQVNDGAATSRHRNGKYLAWVAAAVVAMAALASAGVIRWAAVAASVASLAHLDWIWIPAAIVLESASMAALAGMQRRLLEAGDTHVGVRPMLATTFAANALSVSVPLAGPELGTAFTFRRFTRLGADAPLAGWVLLVGGVAYSVGAVFYALRRPNPWPTVFGHHEFFHACTLVAAICHMIAIYFVLYA